MIEATIKINGREIGKVTAINRGPAVTDLPGRYFYYITWKHGEQDGAASEICIRWRSPLRFLQRVFQVASAWEGDEEIVPVEQSAA